MIVCGGISLEHHPLVVVVIDCVYIGSITIEANIVTSAANIPVLSILPVLTQFLQKLLSGF